MKKFNVRFQELATSKGLAQSDLVGIFGKDKSTISKWWNGEIIPSSKNMRAICDYFGCDLSWLRYGDGGQVVDRLMKGISQAVTSTGTATVEARGCGPVTVNSNSNVATSPMDGECIPATLTRREFEILARMREHFSPARWARLEKELDDEEKRNG